MPSHSCRMHQFIGAHGSGTAWRACLAPGFAPFALHVCMLNRGANLQQCRRVPCQLCVYMPRMQAPTRQQRPLLGAPTKGLALRMYLIGRCRMLQGL